MHEVHGKLGVLIAIRCVIEALAGLTQQLQGGNGLHGLARCRSKSVHQLRLDSPINGLIPDKCLLNWSSLRRASVVSLDSVDGQALGCQLLSRADIYSFS